MDRAERLAAASPTVEVRYLRAATVLNRAAGARVRLDLTLNPYRGCEFGCRYCYARYTHTFLDHQDPSEFERVVYAKLEAPQRLAAELARLRLAGRRIAIGTACDAYQPVERRLHLTRGLLEALCGCRGATVNLVTKSDLVTRDLDLLVRLQQQHGLWVAFTLLTLDRHLARRLEPRAPTPAKRLAAIARLTAAGVPVGISYGPILPGLNDSPAAMAAVCGAAAQAGASFVFGQVLWIPACARPVLMGWLGEQFPELMPRYRRWYGHEQEAPDEERRRLLERLGEVATAAGLALGPCAAAPAEQQLALDLG